MEWIICFYIRVGQLFELGPYLNEIDYFETKVRRRLALIKFYASI